jgi:hypothetical protein
VCFVLCGRAMENDSLSLAEPSKIFKMYDDTLRFVRNLVGHRTINDNQADTGDTAVARQLDREAKLVTLRSVVMRYLISQQDFMFVSHESRCCSFVCVCVATVFKPFSTSVCTISVGRRQSS